MFPLLSRLPQLSREERQPAHMSTYPLNHPGNNRTPQFVSIYLSLPPSLSLSRSQYSFFPFSVFTVFHIDLLFIAREPQYLFISLFPFRVCAPTSPPLPPLPPRGAFSPPAVSHLSAPRGFGREPLPRLAAPPPSSSVLCCGAREEEKTKRLNILDCTPNGCVLISQVLCLFCLCVCVCVCLFITLNSDR